MPAHEIVARADLPPGLAPVVGPIDLRRLDPALEDRTLVGVALAFARAVGEFGAVILISGNIPFKTQVASVQIFSNIESDRPTAAAALSVVLLAFSFLTLLAIDLVRRWGSKHES